MKKMRLFIVFSAFMVLSINRIIAQAPGCPNISAGPDQNLNCNTTCTNLTATVFATGATTSYAVSSIPYSPPYAYNTGTAILVNQDDIWSGVITLPFDFCMYGVSYTQIVAGSNGCISFGPANAMLYNAWSYTATCPNSSIISGSTGPYVLGPYQDIDPQIAGQMYYAILGQYPCRTFVINWNQVAEFSCTSLISTSQIVLYESTNAIEVYIQNKPLCSSWNSGNAVIGIQNATGTLGICPPGRNTGQWTASNEAWRFTPNGTPNYSISWWHNFAQIDTNATINVCPTSSTTYTAQVIYNSCGNQVVLTDDVNVNVSSTIGLSISPAAPTLCGGASTTLTATSTDPAASFLWSNGLTTPTITVTPATTTTYTVTATTPGCTTQEPVTVTVNSNPVITIPNTAVCAGQAAQLIASGATSYVWNTGYTGDTLTVTPATTTTYTVTGTNTGCTMVGSGVVTVNPLPNPQITSSIDASCGQSNGSATASGGTGYVWSNGQLTATATSLIPGTYTVTVTSAAGCTGTTSVVINNIPPPTATGTNTSETCGHSNGTATASPIGGACAQYTYSWNTFPVQTTQTAINIPAGTYTVTVSCNGCTATATTTVLNMAGPSVTIAGSVNSTCGLSNGSATAAPNGGTTPYQYLWDCTPSQTTPSMTNVAAGTYHISVTDAYGCVATNTVTISTTPVPISSISGFQNAGCNQSNGSATLLVSSGTPPFTFNWNSNPIQTTQNLANVPTGNYSVTVTDTNGCTTSTTVNIPQNPGPTATTSSTDEDCGKGNGTATVIAIGGTGFYTYTWSTNPPQTSTTLTGLSAGVFTVTVNDGFCTYVTNVSIQNIPGPTASFSFHPTIVTVNATPVTFINNSAGTTLGCTWDFGDGTTGAGISVEHLYNTVGSFPVTMVVTDVNGCMDTVTDTVIVRDIFTFYIPNAFTPNGDIKNDTWFPSGISVDPNNYDCKIFDRWGNLVFSTNTWNGISAEPWNGTLNNKGDKKDALVGVYIYRIILKDIGGLRHDYFGRVTIMP